MASVSRSGRFVTIGGLPVRTICISAGQASEVFSTAQSSALIIEDDGVPLFYLTAQFLDAAMDVSAAEAGEQAATIMSITNILFRYFHEKLHFRDQVDELAKNAITVVPVQRKPLRSDDDEPESTDAGKVYMVYDDVGRRIGWYVSNEQLMDAIRTPPKPAVWVCTLKESHENPTRDHGLCKVCGAKLKRV